MKDKAVRFLRGVAGDPDKADQIEAMSPDEYAEHKRITILENPTTVITQRRTTLMAATASPTKDELEKTLDEIEDIANDALDAELSREEVVAKVKEIYDLACGDEDEDEEEGDEDESPE